MVLWVCWMAKYTNKEHSDSYMYTYRLNSNTSSMICNSVLCT